MISIIVFFVMAWAIILLGGKVQSLQARIQMYEEQIADLENQAMDIQERY